MKENHPAQPARQEAAIQLRKILTAVDEGTLRADSSLGRRLLRRIEGGVTALEASPRPKVKTLRPR